MFENFLTTLIALIAVMGVGALVVMVPPLWNAWLNDKPARLRHLAKRGAVGFLYDQVGGYVHDTGMSQFIPPTLWHFVTGTWTHSAGQVTDTICIKNAAADATTTCNIPIMVPSNSVAQKGAYLTSVEIDFEILTAACDAVSAVFNIVTRGADGSAATVAAQTFTYDSGHDTAGERIDVDQHKMTLTLATPVWLDNDQYALVELTFDRAATTVVECLAAVANFTLRI